jgi:hypothetical protein
MVVANSRILLHRSKNPPTMEFLSPITGEPVREPLPIPLGGDIFEANHPIAKDHLRLEVSAFIRWLPIILEWSDDYLVMDLLNDEISRFQIGQDESKHFVSSTWYNDNISNAYIPNEDISKVG